MVSLNTEVKLYFFSFSAMDSHLKAFGILCIILFYFVLNGLNFSCFLKRTGQRMTYLKAF